MNLIASKLGRQNSTFVHSWQLTRMVVLFYSSSSCCSSLPIYKRLEITKPSVSIFPILDQWVQQGHQLSPAKLDSLATRFRNLKRFEHALQISEWMNEKHSSNLSPRHRANHIELLYTVRGPDQAEKYLDDLPPIWKSPRVYSSLLQCYAEARCLKKAEILMEKMKKFGFAKDNKYPYSIMLKLYFQLRLYDNAAPLLEEMDKKGFILDSSTYRIQLAAYSTTGKVKEMNMVLRKMQADPKHKMTASDYITFASGYLNAGSVEKSLKLLKVAEDLATGKDKRVVVLCLITLYARAKLKEEVSRLWDIYKSSWSAYSKSQAFHVMVNSHVKLDDFETAEKIIDEWAESFSGNAPSDMRIIDPLVHAYGNNGEFDKAEELINKIRERFAIEPKRSTLCAIVLGYLIHNRMEDAVKTIDKALKLNDSTWIPYNNKSVITACLDYLKRKGDNEELLKFMSLIEKSNSKVQNSYKRRHSEDTERHSDLVLDDIELQSYDSENS
ncbi:pentatricopeptide repeat-containing protein At2g20710, mitochondrial-like [Silene latifolia]|uniref:pentatricopeptide repeat-containing protein At2g20710, mitochondrial-like n=1 Tax=Silene latifolia TaxID=37657 RepID=UPI003D788A79